MQRTAADIAIDRQMEHAIHQTFTQRAACQRHAINIQFVENGDENRQTAGKDQRTLQRQPFNFQLFQLAALNSALLQLLQFTQGDTLIHPLRHHDLLQSLNRTGCTDADLPSFLTQRRYHGLQHVARRLFCPVKIVLRQMAIAEKTLQPGDAAH